MLSNELTKPFINYTKYLLVRFRDPGNGVPLEDLEGFECRVYSIYKVWRDKLSDIDRRVPHKEMRAVETEYRWLLNAYAMARAGAGTPGYAQDDAPHKI